MVRSESPTSYQDAFYSAYRPSNGISETDLLLIGKGLSECWACLVGDKFYVLISSSSTSALHSQVLPFIVISGRYSLSHVCTRLFEQAVSWNAARQRQLPCSALPHSIQAALSELGSLFIAHRSSLDKPGCGWRKALLAVSISGPIPTIPPPPPMFCVVSPR
ncbi:hypothetical protein NLJ89_g4550 [Agrocybe chaxingu]|uniref:Uncharacterized protein n=1 Tax=Agrocybe chaxingu TaxID=84603 RepID=A0A9W8K2L0_9AGAR|nr:hypothetical protein NLJ89_g4550 [Agrocybe chaxingu]